MPRLANYRAIEVIFGSNCGCMLTFGYFGIQHGYMPKVDSTPINANKNHGFI